MVVVLDEIYKNEQNMNGSGHQNTSGMVAS